ncbi:hypothetical protein AB835_04110 [Candidatus Endobugula sertula]|uniref:O-antigen ligase-related domain-containing protein n=1 Tax=Candidatus Endobugula sertula TaxID=62101 RepID=A0A1D2QRY6_9GAMM|nr:hypothetical protein AB835_04110 [Candidatus Endobugula sertula]
MGKRNLNPEFYSLCLLAISLPIIEFTKNLACLLLLVFFLYQTITSKRKVLCSPVGNCILIFVIGSIIAAIGAYVNGYDIGKIRDIIRYGSVGWMMIYIPLSKAKIYTLLTLLILSTTVAIINAYWSLHEGREKYFELRSIGHINHSSIYILLTIGATIPLLFLNQYKKINLVILWILLALLMVGLLESNSRATMLALVCISINLVFIGFLKSRESGIMTTSGVLLLAALFFASQPSVFHKISDNDIVFVSDVKTPREKIWNTTWQAWKHSPVFGIGYGNYNIITAEQLSKWNPEKNIDYNNQETYLYSSHAHNRFLNTLVEGGVIGFLSLIVLLFGILFAVWEYKKNILENNHALAFWLILANTLITISVVGLFNTTLHHEHGLLTMMLLALSLRFLSYHLHEKAINENVV